MQPMFEMLWMSTLDEGVTFIVFFKGIERKKKREYWTDSAFQGEEIILITTIQHHRKVHRLGTCVESIEELQYLIRLIRNSKKGRK